MKTFRILMVSNVRPSRTWNFANRILREVPGTEICGIVQRSTRSIPWVQQLIAAGITRKIPDVPGFGCKVRLLIASAFDKIADRLLWLVRGCPAPLNNSRFAVESLIRECSKTGWPLAVTGEGEEAGAATRICHGDVDLAILLGDFSAMPELWANASSGCVRTCNYRLSSERGSGTRGTLLSIEHLAAGTGIPCKIFSLVLPWQPLDGLLGFTLKSDLIADDLLLQTSVSLLCGDPASASAAVLQWANKILTPSVTQWKGIERHTSQTEPKRKRCRSTWKLCLDTLLLFSPSVIGRNWRRRMSGRYPVLILAHHLVSDRPHRMGVPTEIFWRQVLFLRKHYRIASLSEAVELLRSGQVRVPTVVLTFDDGYGDNFLNLRAVAHEAGISPTLFITTAPVETHREFDHDLVTGTTGFLPLTWDQIQYWNARGAEFGSHTRTHFDCGFVDPEKLRPEIVGSRDDLEAQLKKPVEFFAFPFGKPKNMSSEAMDMAASTYRHFVSSFGGESFPKAGELQSHLHRKKFYSSQWELELELQSVFDFVDAAKEHLHPQVTQALKHSDSAQRRQGYAFEQGKLEIGASIGNSQARVPREPRCSH